jgi:hypothetical protein
MIQKQIKIIKNDNILRVITERNLSNDEENDLVKLITELNFFNIFIKDNITCQDCYLHGLNINMGSKINESHWNSKSMITRDIKASMLFQDKLRN